MKNIVWCAVILALFAAPAAAQDLGAIVASLHEERARYGATMTDEQCVELINAVAWKHRADGWGLSGKDFGTHGVRYDGARVAHDILHHRPTNRIWDVLGAAGAASTPPSSLGPGGPPPGSNRPWVAPIVPQGHVEPPPVPTPGPIVPAPGTPPVDITPILNRLAALETLLTAKLDGIAAVSVEARDTAYQARDHAHEILNGSLPKVLDALAVRPCYAGSQGGWAGGKIRLCPE
jgi:hypothetical protein